MHKVTLKLDLKQIDKSMADYVMRKTIELPFAPFPGLGYCDVGEIEDVHWSGEHFTCTFGTFSFHSEQVMLDVMRRWEKEGWEALPLFEHGERP